MSTNKRVLMAMSGGIDSSVAAILLREQGYELIGVTFRTFDSISRECLAKEKGCCSVDSIMEARRMAREMGFPHHIIDLRKTFEESVIADFIDEYLHGRTPNPCVVCNSEIKWGKLLDMADSLGCGYIATGHYARIASDESGRFYLRKGVDGHKDQTYFLWRLTQENLSRTLFPLGALTKTEVRAIAASHGYVKLSQKAESQEICFIPDNDYRHFLASNVDGYTLKYGEGDFVGVDGKILGRHKGYPNYTIGQRKGLGISLGRPAYVVRIEPDTNRVVLGEKEDLISASCMIKRVNMMKIADFIDGMEVMAKIRYKSQPAHATLWHADGGRIRIELKEPVESVTPGQSAVLYGGCDWQDVICAGVIC